MTEDRTPEDIRREIEETREELADAAAALAYKADVKARAQDRKEEVKADLKGKVDNLKSSVSGTAEGVKAQASNTTPGSVKSAASSAGSSVQATVRRKPLESAAVAAAVLGFALGYLIARRRS